jgi:UDP-glucose 4-epimerase
VARALLAAVGSAGTFNISAGVETHVSGIFDALQEAAGTDVEPLLMPLRPGELERSCMDPTLAGAQTHWRAEIDLRTGLRQTYHALVEEFESALEPGTPSEAR